MKNIILADDHTIIRNGLKMLLESTEEYKIVYSANNGEEILEAIDSGIKADLIVSDLHMPKMNGFELLKTLNSRSIDIPVLIISMMVDDSNLYKVMSSGAKGFLSKSVDSDELFFAISRVISGARYICSDLSVLIIDRNIKNAVSSISEMSVSDFSSREIEILQLIGQGLTNAEMADKLFISKRTVEGHRQSLIDKTGSKNTAVLIRYAFAKGLIN